MTEFNEVKEEGWKITNKETADWALSRIQEAENEIEKNDAYADMQMEKIKVFKEDSNKEYRNTIDFMTSQLQGYLMAEGKKKIVLINGQISFRKQIDKWVIDSPEELIKTLEGAELNDLINVTKKPKLADMKKTFAVTDNGDVVHKETGEFVNGIKVESREDKFNFKTK